MIHSCYPIHVGLQVDEATTQLLEEHVIMTQSMAFSPYKAPFEDRIVRWEAQLSLASEIVESWLTVQRAWMYLEPIFASPDIMQQLPVEGKRFATVDRTWRKTSVFISKASDSAERLQQDA
jgi:dynein heavy chain, axonemal